MKWESWWNIEGVYWDPSLHLLSAYDIKAVKRNMYAICTSKYIKNICYVKYLLFFLRFFLFLWCCCTHLIFEIWRPDIIYFARTVSFLYNWALMKAPMMHGEVLSIGGRGGHQVIIQKAWPSTIVGSVFEECHAPCTIKTSFVDL